MLSLGKSLPLLSYQLVLYQATQGPSKSWKLYQETEHTHLPRWFQGWCFAVCSRSCLYKTAIWAVQRFAAENKLRPTVHQQYTLSSEYWSLVPIIYFFLFPFHVFFISNSCQIILTFPVSLVSRATGTNAYVSCLTVFRRQSFTFWQLWEPWGKGLRPPSWADVQQQLRSTVPSSSSSCNRYPLVSSQQRCSITVLDPTTGLLLLSQKWFLISCQSASAFYFINYRLSCESFHMPALGVMVHEKSH